MSLKEVEKESGNYLICLKEARNECQGEQRQKRIEQAKALLKYISCRDRQSKFKTEFDRAGQYL